MAEITAITATLGRESLADVGRDMAAQIDATSVAWIVIGDGVSATARAREMLKNHSFNPIILEAPATNKPKWQYELIFQALDHVVTPYVCIIDDDNRFNNDHIKTLLDALQTAPFVATARTYFDEGEALGVESYNSELIDSNNAGYTTDFLKRLRNAWYYFGSDPTYCDRDLQFMAHLMRIYPKRIPNRTVSYKVNRRRLDPKLFRCGPNEEVYETLGGSVFKSSRKPQK